MEAIMSITLAERYILLYGEGAIERFIADLMADDPVNHKRGYSRENAVIAASDAFKIPREELV
jgi:hypothetical protein